MANENYLNIAAEVVEKVAAYVDAIESDKKAAVTAERAKIAEQLKNKFNEATGESLSDDLVEKLASADGDIVALVEKLAGSSQPPVPMGGPGEVRDDSAAPRTTKEAAYAADDRFVAWLST